MSVHVSIGPTIYIYIYQLFYQHAGLIIPQYIRVYRCIIQSSQSAVDKQTITMDALNLMRRGLGQQMHVRQAVYAGSARW